MTLGTLTINTNDSPHTKLWQILLDDIDISKHISGVLIDIRAGGLPCITLDCIDKLIINGKVIGDVDTYNSRLELERVCNDDLS